MPYIEFLPKVGSKKGFVSVCWRRIECADAKNHRITYHMRIHDVVCCPLTAILQKYYACLPNFHAVGIVFLRSFSDIFFLLLVGIFFTESWRGFFFFFSSAITMICSIQDIGSYGLYDPGGQKKHANSKEYHFKNII